MKELELRNIKVHEDMSDETTCFSADMWRGGSQIGLVRNDGQGGSHVYEFTDREAEKALRAHVKTLPPVTIDNTYGTFVFPADLDHLVNEELAGTFPEEETDEYINACRTAAGEPDNPVEWLAAKIATVEIKNGVVHDVAVPKGVILKVVDLDSRDEHPEVRTYIGPDTHFTRLPSLTESCEFIPLSKALPSTPTVEFWSAISDNAPFSWGDNNRTLVTAARLLEHCRDRLEDDEPVQLTPFVVRAKEWMKDLQMLGDTYIDLEN